MLRQLTFSTHFALEYNGHWLCSNPIKGNFSLCLQIIDNETSAKNSNSFLQIFNRNNKKHSVYLEKIEFYCSRTIENNRISLFLMLEKAIWYTVYIRAVKISQPCKIGIATTKNWAFIFRSVNSIVLEQ